MVSVNVERNGFYAGLLFGLGLYLSYLGRHFDFLPHVTRGLSVAFLLFSVYYVSRLKSLRYNFVQKAYALSLFFIVVVCLLQSSSAQIDVLVSFSKLSDVGYVDFKLLKIFGLLIPVLFVSLIHAFYRISEEYVEGFIVAAFVVSLIGLVIVVSDHEYLTTSAWSLKLEYAEVQKYSIIKVAVLCVNGLVITSASIFLLGKKEISWVKKAIMIVLMLFFLYSISISLQRSAWVFSVMMLSIYGYFFLVGKSAKGIAFLLLLVSGTFSVLVLYGDDLGIFNSYSSNYFSRLVGGDLLDSRSGLIGKALEGIRSNPIYGFGLGDFSSDGFSSNRNYPHNFVLESGYELGIVGLFFSCVLWLIMAAVLVRTFKLLTKRIDFSSAVLFFLMMYAFVVVNKSGDISELGVCIPLFLVFGARVFGGRNV